MKMRSKFVMLLVLLIVVALTGYAVADIGGEFPNFDPIVKMKALGIVEEEIAEIMGGSSLPDFEPKVIEELKKEKDFIAAYGEIPAIKNDEEKIAWLDKLDKISDKVNMDRFMYSNNGPVISYGVNYEGYVVIYFLEGLAIDESMLDEIYGEYHKQVRSLTGGNPPVVFQYEALPELSRAQRHRPLFGGIQVESYSGSRSTLGFAIKRVSDGALGYVVSGHAVSPPDFLFQPTIDNENLAGFVSSGDVGGTYADAAYALESDVLDNNVDASIYLENAPKIKVETYFDPSTSYQAVKKSGIATGTTAGYVIEKRTQMSHPIFGTIYNQYIATYDEASGDSGAPVYVSLDPYNSRAAIVGIHMGSLINKSVFSPVSGVYNDLGVIPLTQ